jgi:hypothetical protein
MGEVLKSSTFSAGANDKLKWWVTFFRFLGKFISANRWTETSQSKFTIKKKKTSESQSRLRLVIKINE